MINPISRMNMKDRFIRKLGYAKPLTICIAAICERDTPSPTIVYCADRMITSMTTLIQAEHGISKINNFTDNCMVMSSSSHSRQSNLILENARNMITDSDITIQQIAKIISKECQKHKMEEKERNILTDYGFISYTDFMKREKDISAILSQKITRRLDEYESEFLSQFMVFGFDTAPHIYLIDQNGKYDLCDYDGFATIGSGAQLAFTEMTKYLYRSDMELIEALIRVYSAKRVAEKALGVGKLMDLGFLHMHRPLPTKLSKRPNAHYRDIEPEIREVLENCIDRVRESEAMIYGDTIEKIGRLMNKIYKGKTHEKKRLST